jgi:Fe2+ transport system protein FeoA
MKPLDSTSSLFSATSELNLCMRLKSLGFTKGSQMKLYGESYEFMGEPIVVNHSLVLMDATAVKTGQTRRIRIPLPVLKMADPQRNAA